MLRHGSIYIVGHKPREAPATSHLTASFINLERVMKRLATTLLLSLFFLSILTAAPVDEETAHRAAVQWVMNNGTFESSTVTVLETYPFSHDGIRTHYIINLAPDGFIIVSGDDIAVPVLMFGRSGRYDGIELPPALRGMLDAFSRDLTLSLADGMVQSDEVGALWELLLDERSNLRSYFGGGNSIMAVSPLLSTTWNQTYPYNKFCPSTSTGGSGGHVYVGCVATAMAQVMKYHSAPTTGVGSNSYTHSTYGTLSANFGNTTYNYASMPNSINGSSSTAQQNAVATLSYHCGVAVEMNYGPSGSSSSIYYSYQVMPVYFRFKNTMSYVSRSSFSSSSWLAMLTGELDNSRPVLYRGSEQNGTGGHAFVIDGYTGADYFHINWGWGGYLDGYFYLNNLTPSSYNFNYHQKMVIGIEPVSSTPPTLLSPANNTANLCTSPTLQWNSVSGATSYRLQVASDATFATVAVDNSSLTGTSTQVTGLSPATTYYWRMNSTSTSGTSAWSTVWSFTTMSASVTANGPASFCDGESVILSTSPVSGAGYQWSRNGVPVNGATSTMLTVTQSGDYTVAITVNGCVTHSSPYTVTVHPLPTATILPPSSTEICEGGSSILSAVQNPGYSYQWLKDGNTLLGANSPVFTATESGSYALTVSANGCSATSAALAITVHPLNPSDLTWTGAINSEWNTTGNWDSPCATPGPGDNVTIPSGCTPPAAIPAVSLGNLTVNNSAGITLTGNVMINGMLTLQQGTITLGNSDLIISAAGEIVGGSSSSHIITDGMGQLTQLDIGSGGRYRQILFPVANGDGKYVPLRLLNLATSNDFSIRASDEVLEKAFTGAPITSDAVDNTWIVTHGSGSTNITMSLFWPSASELTGFDRNNCFISSNPSGNTWTALHAGMQAQGSDPYSLTLTGITTLSSLGMPFTVGSGQQLYPVELLSFAADAAGDKVKLHWVTGMENNNHGFEIERRHQHQSAWSAVGFVPASNAATHEHRYSFIDTPGSTGILEYRLRQIDLDGSSGYSPIVSVLSTIPENLHLSEVAPQPLRHGQSGTISLRTAEHGRVQLRLFDALGREVRTLHNAEHASGAPLHISIPSRGLPAGMYFLHCTSSGTSLLRRFHILH